MEVLTAKSSRTAIPRGLGAGVRQFVHGSVVRTGTQPDAGVSGGETGREYADRWLD